MRTTTPGPSTTVGDRDLPQLYLANDQKALSRQSESLRATRTQLILLLIATATAVIAQRFDSQIAAGPAAVMYGLAILMGVRTSRRHAHAHWQVHRDAAEFMKSLAWQYMVRGGPFPSHVPDPDGVFAERLEERLLELRRVGWTESRTAPQIMATGQITPVMRAVRAKPFTARRDIYLRDRMLEQMTWYRNRSLQEHRAALRWSAVSTALTLLALLTAAVQALGLSHGGWDLTGLLASAAAACVGWQEVRRHRPLHYAHALVEQDLEALRVTVNTTVTEDCWARTVATAERLVSPQHTDWLARFGS
ncbi:DUF4231 domain-containing protein [Streptomyces sp. H39-S7]|uniref:DUF4231 domain-containing protein n=1 Tax=Streptomyces sp. H39-S7 TaxID=3004357 RepID=UPI0022AEEA10|nr:DUF4231 domain-containing protein [Streptomyces sp. H39-S7]MCZ4122283.1 DUF4231 domain-containing protein [Streptomyces sp. H39-S7]